MPQTFPSKATDKKIMAYYDDGGYYAYVLLSSTDHRMPINSSDIADVTKKLRSEGIETVLSGISYRPASDGKQYEFYLRVTEKGKGSKPSREKVTNVLRELLGDFDEKLTQETQAYIKQLLETIEHETQEKYNLQQQLQNVNGAKAALDVENLRLGQEIQKIKEESHQKSLLLQQQRDERLKERAEYQARLSQFYDEAAKDEEQPRVTEAEIEKIMHEFQEEQEKLKQEYLSLEHELSDEMNTLRANHDKMVSDIKVISAERDRVRGERDYFHGELDNALLECKELRVALSRKNDSVPAIGEGDFEELLACLLPEVDFVEGSMSVLINEIQDFRPALRKIKGFLSGNIKPNDTIKRDGYPTWLEYHFSTGVDNNGRIYSAKAHNGKSRVWVSKKATQKRDIERLKEILL